MPGPRVTIQGDGDQLEQLLINLIRNAVDAVRETGGGVHVGWQRLPGSSPPTMELWVDDEGPGLSNTGNLFVPFFTTKPGGSGIGLVLSRQIAEAHGGSLILENREDRLGCRASLRIPLHAGDRGEARSRGPDPWLIATIGARRCCPAPRRPTTSATCAPTNCCRCRKRRRRRASRRASVPGRPPVV